MLLKKSRFHFSVVLQSIFSKHMKVTSFQVIVICKIFKRKNCEVQKHPDLDNGWKIETLTSPYWDFYQHIEAAHHFWGHRRVQTHDQERNQKLV